MVSFPMPSPDVPVAAAATTALTTRAPPQSSRHLLTRDERKEKYMAKTRFEAAYLFKYLILTQIVVYLEAGAIPCLLDQLSVSLSMTAAQQGALGGVVYLALSAASPLCAFCLHRFNPKHVLGLSLILNNLAVLLLAFTPTGYTWSAELMIAARAAIGFTQAFPCVYTPLWVDEYAPREKVAGWMSYLQGSVPMGVMLGYFIGTVSNWIVPESFQVVETWRWPFVVQFVWMCPIMIAIWFVPKRHVVIRSEGSSSGSADISLKSPGRRSDASISSGGDVCNASTSDVSEYENQSIEAAEALLIGAIDATGAKEPVVKTKQCGRPPKSVGYSSNNDARDAPLRHTIAGGDAMANDDAELALMLARNGPPTTTRSSYVHKDEEDALLASASMYGGSSQRGLRQLVQNHQYHSYSLSEADASTHSIGSTSSFRRALLQPTPPSNSNSNNNVRNSNGIVSASASAASIDLERGHELKTSESQSKTLARLPASPIRASTYGAFDTSATLPPPPISTTNKSLLDQSILEEEFCEVYEQGSFADGLVELAHIPIFGLIVAGLTAVYFVVTGVQYWSTIFMIKSLHASKYLVNALFVVVAGTGPIFGVFYGGWLIDRYGGYIGIEQRAKSLGICMLLGITAFVIAAITTFFDDIYVTAAFLWLLLFFGGSILPACTGIFISVVPAEHRALASSLSVMVFNLFGYSLSPYLTGLMMEYVLSHQTPPLDPSDASVAGVADTYLQSCDEACAYRLGFRFCLFWSIGSVICIGSAYRLAKREAENARHVLAFYAPSTTTAAMPLHQRSVSSDEV